MKVYQLLEEMRPILLDLIDQRMSKGDTVRLDFSAPKKGVQSLTVSGKVTMTNGRAVYFLSPAAGFTRFTFDKDADSKYVLVKGDRGWKVQAA